MAVVFRVIRRSGLVRHDLRGLGFLSPPGKYASLSSRQLKKIRLTSNFSFHVAADPNLGSSEDDRSPFGVSSVYSVQRNY